MAPRAVAPSSWINQDIVLYHGTTDASARAIVGGKIRVVAGRPYTDFGPGFYTTTVEHQAQSWADELAARKVAGGLLAKPSVVEITLQRDLLARLESLVFVLGNFHADDFWSLVHYCRTGALDHSRTAVGGSAGKGRYDVVYGPVSAFWTQRSLMADADQISFHTVAAELLLNTNPQRRII